MCDVDSGRNNRETDKQPDRERRRQKENHRERWREARWGRENERGLPSDE